MAMDAKTSTHKPTSAAANDSRQSSLLVPATLQHGSLYLVIYSVSMNASANCVTTVGPTLVCPTP